MALVLCALTTGTPGVSQATSPPSPPVILVLTDGSQLTGAVIRQSPDELQISTNSFHETGAPPVSIALGTHTIASCSMVNPALSAITIAGHLCAAPIPVPRSGFQQASLAVGYIGSAQRDESARATLTFAAYQGQKATGSFRGKSSLYLSGSYDDKWKSTPLSSNVTQTYQGLLTQNMFSRLTPASQCSSDDYPLAYRLVGYAYHNNSQGIEVDQSYGLGLAKSLVVGKPAGPPGSGCVRAADVYSHRIELSADIRSVNYILYPPGHSVHGVGTQWQIGYSRSFPSRQVVVLTLGGVPVYNRVDMSQASGLFEYFIPLRSSWAVQFSVADNYYEIAPKTFNKNYINLSVGFKFTAPKTARVK